MRIIIDFDRENVSPVIEECERIIACIHKLTKQKYHRTKSVRSVEQRLIDFNIKAI